MSSFACYKIILLMYIYQTMSNNFGFIDIILLAMIAGFIILRLRNILGKKTGHEPKIPTLLMIKNLKTINHKKKLNLCLKRVPKVMRKKIS